MLLNPSTVVSCMQEAAPAMAVAAGVDISAADLMLDLSAARHTWLAKNAVLLLLKSGQMLIAHLTIEAGMIRQMKVSPLLHLPELLHHCCAVCMAAIRG